MTDVKALAQVLLKQQEEEMERRYALRLLWHMACGMQAFFYGEELPLPPWEGMLPQEEARKEDWENVKQQLLERLK